MWFYLMMTKASQILQHLRCRMTGILLCGFLLCLLKWTKSTSSLIRPNFNGKKPKHFASYCQQEDRLSIEWSTLIQEDGDWIRQGVGRREREKCISMSRSKFESASFQIQVKSVPATAKLRGALRVFQHTYIIAFTFFCSSPYFAWSELSVFISNMQNASLKKHIKPRGRNLWIRRFHTFL